jgi:hypothetical protein
MRNDEARVSNDETIINDVTLKVRVLIFRAFEIVSGFGFRASNFASSGTQPFRMAAARSHRHTARLFSGSTASPTFLSPHFSRTRVEAFVSAKVCAQMPRQMRNDDQIFGLDGHGQQQL